jgi:hypothetical protein
MEINPLFGVGVGDLHNAMRAEIDRIVADTKGDPLAQTQLLQTRLRQLGLVTDQELTSLSRLAELSSAAARGTTSAQAAYFESRDLYNGLLATTTASPVALVIASSAVGSYSISESSDGSGTVIFAKNNGEWEHRGRVAGAVIGANWGPFGAAVGGEVGGLIGAAVDHCTN